MFIGVVFLGGKFHQVPCRFTYNGRNPCADIDHKVSPPPARYRVFSGDPDFAVFAAAWDTSLAQPNYNADCDIFDPPVGIINAMDLTVFADNWLATVE